jgi:hypothetical protein
VGQLTNLSTFNFDLLAELGGHDCCKSIDLSMVPLILRSLVVLWGLFSYFQFLRI